MNILVFLLALAVMTGMNLFVYFSHPLAWRNNAAANAVLILFHVLAWIFLALIFALYKRLPEGIKPLVSRMGTIFYILIMDMTILYGASSLLRILKGWFKGSSVPQSLLNNKPGWALVFLAVSLILAGEGIVRIGKLHRTEYDIHISKPAGCQSLKAVLAADIHAGAGTWKETYAELREMLEKENADVILIAGDVFDETTSDADIDSVRSVFEGLHPKYGIYYVYGNHDDSHEDISALLMRSMGVCVLEDEMAKIKGIQLIGRLDPKLMPLEIETLLDRCGAEKENPIFVLQHRPIQFQRLSENGVDLVMAGHTHGFNIPQFVPVGLSSDLYYGIRRYHDMTAVVTSGVSAWGFHYKFPAESEIVVLNLSFEE